MFNTRSQLGKTIPSLMVEYDTMDIYDGPDGLFVVTATKFVNDERVRVIHRLCPILGHTNYGTARCTHHSHE